VNGEKCIYGDHLAEKYQSGRPICWKGWNWNKLDEPAARHWVKVAEAFLSNVDMYDLQSFIPDAGADVSVLENARKILEHSKLVLEGSPCRNK